VSPGAVVARAKRRLLRSGPVLIAEDRSHLIERWGLDAEAVRRIEALAVEHLVLAEIATLTSVLGFPGAAEALIMPPELPDELSKVLAQIREGQRVDHYETVRMRKDGRRIEVSITVSPVQAPSCTLRDPQDDPHASPCTVI
jgi:hypothetical protein